MMPPTAAAGDVPDAAVTVACSSVREHHESPSHCGEAGAGVTAASRSQREGNTSVSPPNQGTSVRPASSISHRLREIHTK